MEIKPYQTNIQDMESFFDKLQYRVDTISHYKKSMDVLLASDFNVFDFISPDENRLSDILAFLLNPGAAHGQGNIFLINFLNILSENNKDTNKKIPDLMKNSVNRGEKVIVRREAVTDHISASQRRMDILLEIHKFGLMIENKPFALDQIGQLRDYSNDLSKRFSDSLIVYLSGDGKQPSEESLSKNEKETMTKDGRLVCISYAKDILKWLIICRNHTQAEKIRWFVRDFYSYVDINFKAD